MKIRKKISALLLHEHGVVCQMVLFIRLHQFLLLSLGPHSWNSISVRGYVSRVMCYGRSHNVPVADLSQPCRRRGELLSPTSRGSRRNIRDAVVTSSRARSDVFRRASVLRTIATNWRWHTATTNCLPPATSASLLRAMIPTTTFSLVKGKGKGKGSGFI